MDSSVQGRNRSAKTLRKDREKERPLLISFFLPFLRFSLLLLLLPCRSRLFSSGGTSVKASFLSSSSPPPRRRGGGDTHLEIAQRRGGSLRWSSFSDVGGGGRGWWTAKSRGTKGDPTLGGRRKEALWAPVAMPKGSLLSLSLSFLPEKEHPVWME